jgi:adenine-specific DNA-methyltransferase
MASIETLIGQIDDPLLKAKLAAEVADMKSRLDWGLVFERHLPENVRALSAPVKPGSVVWERRGITPRRLRVRSTDGVDLLVVAEPQKSTAPADAPTERVGRADVLVEQDFGEPVFPVLVPIEALRLGPQEAPHHAVIEGENYHALQMLLAAYESQVDVLYLDPPYNTGERDWSYNNDYVDPNDAYRPSKWLAFMERRLRLGRRLLKPNGVMIVTVDRFEVNHLGMLLEQLFPESLRQMVSICINPSGAGADGLSRVDEYAYFLFFGGALPAKTADDMLNAEDGVPTSWESLLRRGSTWTRARRKNLCYPVYIDAGGRLIRAGKPLEGEEETQRPTRDGDLELAWPVRKDGTLGIWRVDAQRLMWLHERGFAYATQRDVERGTWSIKYLMEGGVRSIERGDSVITGRGSKGEAIIVAAEAKRDTAKSMWHRGRHNAGAAGGTQLLSALLGKRGVFSYPKSVYAVQDAIDVAAGDRPNALIMDFFAGSGTTLHATLLLNRADGGSRRCILVTNNEVRAETADALNKHGHFRGDAEFEAMGVFEAACRPRVRAALTGRRPDGAPVEGEYLDGRDYAAGFPENVEFFRLEYLDAAEVEFGLRFTELHPLLWLKAGGVGERPQLDATSPLGLAPASPYAILFDPSGLPRLLETLPNRRDIRHIFVVADSPESFTQTVADLPSGLATTRLYRDYLETLRGATR